jgi:hypothetical protein
MVQTGLGKKRDPISKITVVKKGWRVVEHKILSSYPSTSKKLDISVLYRINYPTYRQTYQIQVFQLQRTCQKLA